LRAVAVQHNDDQYKTHFQPKLLNTDVWASNIIKLLKDGNREDILNALKTLALKLQEQQTKLEQGRGEDAKIADTVMFLSTTMHAAPAPKDAASAPKDATAQKASNASEDERVTSYMQFVPRNVLSNNEFRPLIDSLYASEHVFDRRTMVCPYTLISVMKRHGEPLWEVERAEQLLVTGSNPLNAGRV
jgi:hypothetical protein